jgi:hypothetical protein
MQGESMVLDIFACMGGVELRVPNNWYVIFKAIPILGGMDNSTSPAGDNQNSTDKKKKSLIVKGMAIMGGIEVKN